MKDLVFWKTIFGIVFGRSGIWKTDQDCILGPVTTLVNKFRQITDVPLQKLICFLL